MKRAQDTESVWRETIQQAIAEQAFPGAVLKVGNREGVLATVAAGWHTYAKERELRSDDLFDLASLTKVVGTTSIAMRLHGRGELDLAAPVGDYLPDFLTDDPRRCQITVAHLLAHASGLPAWLPFHRGPAESLAERRWRLLTTPLEEAPNEATIYSDLGLMTLGFLLAERTGLPLPVLAQQEVFGPLGMAETIYTPAPVLHDRCVPTECNEAGIPCQGVVHDENARWLDGVAGHAGLFAPATDLARLATCLLGGGDPVFAQDTVELFTRPAGLVSGSTRCLGWDGVGVACSGGRYIGPHGFGHTGFTGTSLWIDPDHDLFIVLLTNAVHPRRETKAARFFPWRRAIHESVYTALGLA